MRGITWIGMIGAVALVGGCAIGSGEDEATGEAQKPLGFSVWQRTQVGATKIGVTQGGWVEVTISGFHLSPAGCSKVKAADLILSKLNNDPAVKPADQSRRKIAPDGRTKFETWNALPAGDYIVSIDPIGQIPECKWVGDVFTASH